MNRNLILVVEDDPELREALADTLTLAGYAVMVATDGGEAMEMIAVHRNALGLIISDVQMAPVDGLALLTHTRSHFPEIPVLLMTAYGTVPRAVEAMRKGAADYLVKPFDGQELIAAVQRHLDADSSEDADMVCSDQRSRYLAALARRVAGTDATVMITGESGAGKEVLARFIHRNSARAGGPFVAINCAAIPESMLEATLFGFEKGAFTGALAATPGKFEQAQHGTLLLDEITEMDIGLQAKLLRVLQEREVERLGGRRTIALDVRVLATSNRSLAEAVAAGRFREDLYYRLNVFPLHMPALRERSGDILPLARRMLARGARMQGRPVPGLDASAEAALLAHSWPGNVRELDNVMQRALILQDGPVITAADLSFECSGEVAVPATAQGSVLEAELRERERSVLLETLREVSGSRKAAAERLGISERTLRYKLARIRREGMGIPV
jgi:two-component system response regulator FlrC